MKSKRQEKILELIEKYNIETQEELIARLAECGIESKQLLVWIIWNYPIIHVS